MTTYQKRTVYSAAVTLVFFLTLSLITEQWGFFLWSLLPVSMVLATSFTTKNKERSK